MTTNVITVNPGSHSLRLDLVEVGDDEAVRVCDSRHTGASPTGEESLAAFDDFLHTHRRDVAAVAHRVVHGGEHILRPQPVGKDTLDQLRAVEPLAPSHVPVTVQLVERVGHAAPDMEQVLCPDTGFHRTLPTAARTEPLPQRWRSQVRRFGFHGLSYAWALRRTAELLGRDAEQVDVLIAHLGGGCSVCAVHEGRSVDTTMGFTPLGGIPMSRRTGDLDPGVLFWLLRNTGRSIDELEEALQGESGLLGLSDGRSGDTRELVAAADDGDEAARLALEVFCKRAAAGLAGMATGLDSLDAVVFTGEIGWNQPEVRRDVCGRLSLLGVTDRLSGNRDDDGAVSPSGVEPPVFAVQPREELQLAIEAAGVTTHR